MRGVFVRARVSHPRRKWDTCEPGDSPYPLREGDNKDFNPLKDFKDLKNFKDLNPLTAFFRLYLRR